MFPVYNLFIHGYFFFIKTLSLRNQKAKLWIDGRANWEIKLKQQLDTTKQWIWFHCVSVGEYEDTCEVMFSLMRKNTIDCNYLLTFSSPSGFELHKQNTAFDLVFYLPLDTRKNAESFLSIVNPLGVIFSRSELWINMLNEVRKREIPLFLLSLKMNAASGFLRWPAAKLYKEAFSWFSCIYCQDEQTRKLLLDFSKVRKVEVVGNTRFERILLQTKQHSMDHKIERFTEHQFTLICGSSLPKDLWIVYQCLDELRKRNIRLIIVPHEVKKQEITELKKRFSAQVYSEMTASDFVSDVLIIDHVGSLKHYYSYSDFALIGGGFNRIGIHNIIEPAVHGVPVAFGPNHRNYPEALDLIELKLAFQFRNKEEFLQLMDDWMVNSNAGKSAEMLKDYVYRNSTNSEQIAQHMLSLL